jgi:hypothetical protein
MHKVLPITAAAAAIALSFLPMTVATAAPAATPSVLTTGKLGGPSVKVGAKLTASLTKGAKATFFEHGSTNGITCRSSTFIVKVVKNPRKPGTAIETQTNQTFGKCTSAGISEVAGVNSVTILNTPKTTISDSKGFPVTVFNVSTKLSLRSVISPRPIICTYTAGKVKGNASNAKQVLTFKNQVFKKKTGPQVCPPSGDFSASFGPVIDTSVKGRPHVFVN